jgi:hypothetical protein
MEQEAEAEFVAGNVFFSVELTRLFQLMLENRSLINRTNSAEVCQQLAKMEDVLACSEPVTKVSFLKGCSLAKIALEKLVNQENSLSIDQINHAKTSILLHAELLQQLLKTNKISQGQTAIDSQILKMLCDRLHKDNY